MRIKAFITALLCVGAFVLTASAAPNPNKVRACVKSDGTVSFLLNKKCKANKGETEVTKISQLETSGSAIAFAACDQTGTLKNLGGSQTTSVSVVRVPSGQYDVTFTGSYPALTSTDSADNRNKLSLVSTAFSGNFGVTNGFITSATSTEIKATFYTWISDNVSTTADTAGGSIAIYLGSVPPT